MDTFLKLGKQEKRKFYQSQFEYYKKFNSIVLFLIVLSSLAYFISDCQLFGRFAIETLPSRLSIVVVYSIYMLVTRRSNNAYFVTIASNIIGHCVMWCTIGAIVYLPNRQYASDGFIIMQIVMLVLGFAAPFEVAAISQLMIIVNIIISNTFIGYEDFSLMISLGLPCSIGIAMAQYAFKQCYFQAYKANQKLTKMSFIDQLTGVYNRHIFDKIAPDGKIEGYNLIEYISFIIIDIDFFKKINDTYGHDVGDEVLQRLASILKEFVSGSNYVVRWGGEEFIVMLRNHTENQAYNLAEQIRKHIESNNSNMKNITISLGVAKYNNIDINSTIKSADIALYKAKTTGRNKVVKYSDMNSVKIK